jgi:hypothetical protein
MSVFDEAMLRDKTRQVQSLRGTAEAIKGVWPKTASKLLDRADALQSELDDDGMFGLDQWLSGQSDPNVAADNHLPPH